MSFFIQNSWSQNLASSTANGSSNTTSSSFVDVTGATVSITADAGTKVLVTASFSGKIDSGSAIGTYRLVDDESQASGEIQRSNTANYGIGSVVYIFNVATTGTHIYKFQHKTTLQTLESNVAITAIALYDGVNLLKTNVKTLSTPIEMTSSTFETALASDVVTTTANGGFYVSASVQSANTIGSGLVAGEWVLQYKYGSGGNWYNISYTVSRSTSGTGLGVVNLVAALPNTRIAGDYYFRVAHRKTSGTDTYETQAGNLVAVALGTNSGYYPVLITSKSSATNATSSFTDVISNVITPFTTTSLFLQAQYNMSATASIDAPQFDLFAKQGVTTVLDGLNHSRYLSSATDLGSGTSVGLLTGMTSGLPYDIALRHASVGTTTLTTSNAYLVGFGTYRSSLPLISPVTVYATEGLPYSSFSTLKDAFDAINAGTFNGDITVQINSNTTETASAQLFGSGTGSSIYNSVSIYPTTSGVNITGNIAAPIINLNGADNVSIDGRINGVGSTKSLSIINTNIGGSVIQFIGDATANSIKYTTVQGVTSSATSGLIVFGTGSLIGNDNNTIQYCDIRDGATTPANAIYSSGSSVVADNSSITISNNNIYNYFSATTASNGIFVAANSSAWTIDTNRFYQTATRTTTTASLTHRTINIITASGVNYNISNNIIGYSDVASNGTTIYSGQSTVFRGIEITAGATSPSSIQGNIISNINFSTTSGTTAGAGIFSGISILGGQVNVGTTQGNTIGAAIGTSLISITSTTSLGVLMGIYSSSTSDVVIQNNKIGAISTSGTATIGYTFRGINSVGVGGNYTISSNTIGSTTTPNSITAGSDGITTAVCRFEGINNSASGTISISNNIVQNTTVYGTGLSVYYGIVNTGGTGTIDIASNSIVSGTNTGTHTSTTQTYYPIYNSAVVSTLNINYNIIKNQQRTQVSGLFTAIANVGAILSAININGNKLGEGSDGLINYSAASTAALIGISNSAGAASCELSIQNNDIRGITYSSGIAGANAHTYIINSATTLTQNISYNTFSNLNVNTTGAILFISNSVAMPANGIQNVNNNSIITAFTRNSASAAGSITLFSSTASTNNNNVIVNNNNNNFSNITISGGATILGWVNTDAGTGSYTKTIDGNIFNNWTGGTGAITALNVNITSTDNAVKNNTISNISSTGSITGITTAAGNDTIFSNSINNLTSSGGVAATIVSGINVTAATTKNIYSNTIFNLTGNTLTTGSVRGVLISGGSTVNFYQNTIYGITANAITTGTVSGVWVSGGSLVTVNRNKIYDITSTSGSMSGVGAVHGIQVSGSVANLVLNIRNNIIGDLQASAANLANPVIGIGIISTGVTSNINVYYNTIYLNASSTGTTFGASGIYHTISTTATTATLDLRNNIIVNLSTPKGATGYAVAFRRSLGTANTNLNNYASTSNNNLFYAGTPSTYRLIYYDGTSNAQTIALYKAGIFTAGTISPRDQASVTESPLFLSTLGANANYLHINPTTATQIESGAVNITDITLDYDGEIRQGNTGYTGTSTTAPDIGADEGNFTPLDTTPPSITYTQLANNSCTTNQNFSAIITDGTGVNTTSGTRPRIYFKKSTNLNVLPATNTNTTDGWKYVEASTSVSPFNFTINYALINGGVTTGDLIQYFIVAQDIVTPTAYVGINKGTFAATPSSVALTSSAFPIGGTINSFTLLAGLNGTVTVGSGGTYPTLTGAGGLFENINSKGMSANLTANIISDITEPGTNSLNAITYGCDAFNTLTISPSGGGRTLSGSVASGALINLNGADYVVIDGLNTGGNSLTISNTSTASTAGTSTIRFINDATNNIVRNCTIEGSSNLITSGTVLFSTGASTGNDGNSIINNTIKAAGTNLPVNTIYSLGSTVLVDNSNNTISNNNIQDYFSPTLASNGVFITTNNSAWTISGNKFFQTATRTGTTAATHRAIQILSSTGLNYTIENNIIGYANASQTGVTVYDGVVGNLYRAIELTVGIASTSSVQGNTIAGISFSTTSGSTTLPGIFSGISVLAGSVNIGTTSGNTIGASTGTGSIAITSTTSLGLITGIYSTSTGTVSIQNNNIGSIRTGGTALIGYTFHGIYTTGGGQYTTTSNVIGSTSTPNSITIGTSGVSTTPVCTLNGITNVATGTISITGNTIRNVSVFGTGASVMNGILNSGVSGSVSVNNNNIIALNNTGTGALIGISNTVATTTLNINNNIIRNVSKSVATGVVTGISNTGGVLTSISIENNQLGNIDGGLVNYSTVANSGALTGISNTAGSANCSLSIQNNDIRGITYDVVSTNAHTYIINSAATLSQNISGNTFTNLSVNTTGAILFISNSVVLPAYGVQNINSNSIVTAYTRIASSGALTLFTSTAITNNSNVIVNNNNNNFSNITVNGTATILGWINTDTGSGLVTKTIDGNTFNNWNAGTGTLTALTVSITSTNNATKNNTISNIISAGSITGITTGTGNDIIFSNSIFSLISSGTIATTVKGIAISTLGTSKNIYLNTIYNLQANGITTGSVSGIEVAGGTSNTLYSNKIHTISSSSSGITSGKVNGILITGNVVDQITTIYNNRIGNLQASAANVTEPIRGISVANTGARSITNVYFNTVYLNATSSGAIFGSTGIYHTASSTSTTGTLNLRNNIIVNKSTANGTGSYTVAFRRDIGTVNALNNYSSLSNNNLFYAGVPSSTNLIYWDAVISAQTLLEYKEGNYTAGIIAPRDQDAVTESPDFISTDGYGLPDNFLKINSNSITFCESAGVNISGITTDFEGGIRMGNPGYPAQINGSGTAPDIGADEFDGKLPKVVVANAHANSNGTYINFSTAFDAINSNDQTNNNITVSIVGSVTENASVALGAGTWSSLKIFPSKTGLTVSGNIANAPLIDLNGADNVTIDGRVNQTGTTKSLVISNTSTSSGATTATIRWRNSAENNTLKYCTVLGSSTSTTAGVITFATSFTGNGNDNNSIENCNISNAGGNRPINTIYSAGSSGSDNSQITITNNTFYDFLNNSNDSNGIHLNAFTSDCTITNNSFYETTTFVPTANNIGYNAIRIDNSTGNNFSITNNFIGGKAASCGGTSWTVSASTTHNFRGIYLNVGTTTASSVQNNVIRNWSYSTASIIPWRGIEINSGLVNIGTVTANSIGASTGTGSISITSSANAKTEAIYIGGDSTTTISKNSIGSITLLGSSTTSHSFAAIYKASVAGLATISNNAIGSSVTSNSIYCGSTANTASVGQDLIGIYLESSGTSTLTSNTIINLKNEYTGSQISRTRGIYAVLGTFTLIKNTIYNLSSASLNTTEDSVIGIEMDSELGTFTVTDSQIYNLSNTNSIFSGGITGIQAKGLDNNNLVNRNFIHRLSVNASSTNANLYGIRMVDGGTTFANNIISLGGNTATTIYGIFGIGTRGDNAKIYFNTIYIGGNLASGITNKSFGLYGADDGNRRNIRNNIFANFRSTLSGSSLHYAAYFNYSGNTKLTLNYNDYYVGGEGGVLGFHDGADVATVPIISGEDNKSIELDPLLVNPGGSTAVDYKVRESLEGKNGTGFDVDFGQNARSVPPSMGAWELNANRWFGTISTDFNDAANWSAGAVPLDEADVVFAITPLNNCVLDMNRTIGSIINTQSTYNFVTNGKELTILKGLFLTGGARIDASSASTKLIFQGEDAQIIPDATFLGDTVPNITIDNIFGVTTEGSFTITETLNLLSENPSDSIGCLDTGNNIITLGADAVTIGDSDVTGIINRTSFTYDKNYTFGNKNSTLFFVNNGNPLPSSFTVKTTIGTTPTWRPTSIKRIYEFAQSGADPLLPTAAIISGPYLDSELNGNDESMLVFQSYRTPAGTFYEHGRAGDNTDENWVKLTNINLAFFPATLGSLQISLGQTELETLTWNGSVSTSWTTVNNWTPNGAPSDFVNIIIPDAATTTNDPILPPLTIIKTLKMENGSILNSFTNAQANIKGGDGAWADEGGTFNSGTSTIIFENEAAKFSGTTSFNNITITNGANLYMTDASYMRISGVMNNIGVWLPAWGVATTVEYNGGNQVVVIPNPSTNRYSSLILSGSGTKTMPATILSILNNFTLSGTATATANNKIVIGGNVSIGTNASFDTAAKDLTISGNISHDGIFTTTGSTITLDGVSAQTISGTASTTAFEKLVLKNDFGVSATKNISVNTSIELQSNNPSTTKGCLDMGTNTLFMGQSATTTGDGDVTGYVNRSYFVMGTEYTFGNEFTKIKYTVGPLPNSVTFRLVLTATSIPWKTDAINRYYSVDRVGGDMNTRLSFKLHYLDSELNGLDENNLVLFDYHVDAGGNELHEHGRSFNDTDDNWVGFANVGITFLASQVTDDHYWTIGAKISDNIVWIGGSPSGPTDWDLPGNWEGGVPTVLSDVKIPTGKAYYPILPFDALPDGSLAGGRIINTIDIQSGGTLNASVGTPTLTIVGSSDAWKNNGVLIGGSSTIVFTNANATMSGATNFNNITISSGAKLTPDLNNIMKIADSLNNQGTLNASLYENTIEYNGTNQTVIIPNGTTSGYYHLILSGSNVKTMPIANFQIIGDFSVKGTASAASGSSMSILGDLNIENGATWNSEAFEHIINGNLTIDGNFGTQLNSIIQLAGSSIQNIGGNASINFENLKVNNLAHVNLSTNSKINSLLTLSEGQLIINNYTLGIGGTITHLNGKINVSTLSSLNISGTGNLTFSPNLFTADPSIKDLTVNRNGIVALANQNLTINNTLNLSIGTIDVNNTTLTMVGNTINKVSGNIDASDNNSTVVFDNTIPISLPNATFLGNINNLTIQGIGGVTSLGDITVNKILNLIAGNPSDTKGILDLWDGIEMKTITMGLSGTTTGQGDVTGIVKRTSFLANTNYTFGNQFTYISFAEGGTYPSELKVKIQIGTAPAWQTLTTPIKRIYDFIQTGGVDCIASVSSHYLDSELNGNTENNLVHWTFGNNGQLPDGAHEWGASEINSTNNWITINNVPIGYFPTVFGNLVNTLASSTLFDLIWNGSVSTVWGNLNNWTPLTVPSATSKIVIPDASTTNFDPALPANATILQMTLQSGAILNGSTGSNLTIKTDNGAWLNLGGVFNASTSSVTFDNANAVIGGTTNFYNLVIPSTYSLTMLSNAHIGIAGALTNNGILYTLPIGGSTVEYNGTDQTVANPDPLYNQYYNLILSGSGIKNMPSAAIDIRGNFSMTGSAKTTLNYPSQINGNLNLSDTSELVYNANSSIVGGMNINNTSKMVVNSNKTLTVSGIIANSVGTSGIVLKSDAVGTASLYHQTDNVPATVERYISGAAEDWHFLSSPVSNQTIVGTNWTPSGSYGTGNILTGTGYDMYVWDEPTPCWVYLLNTTGTPKWSGVHASPNFVPGRGYLYSVQASNPTKIFTGNLNNGTVSYPITANNTTDTTLKGFNLIGNPYPSSIDWKAGTGWSRSNLLTTDGSYDMWIWNPLANNYGLCNSVNSVDPLFTNDVTQYIPPMQGFFVRAATNGNLEMSNVIRSHTGASNWMKLSNKKNSISTIKVRIASNKGLGFDEVILQFGYTSNKSGAAKLFSTTKTAPSTYFNVGKEDLSVRYLTNEIDNPIVPLMFKAGSDGDYTFNLNLNNSGFENVFLEDKKTKTLHNLLENPIYKFTGLVKDDSNRFALHFKTTETISEENVSNLIYYDGNDIVVDLTKIEEKSEVKIYDVLGKLLINKKVEGNNIHHFPVSKTNQMLIVVCKSGSAIQKTKVLIK